MISIEPHDKKIAVYKWTVKKNIHDTECCPAPLCIPVQYTMQEYDFLVGCLLFSLLDHNCKCQTEYKTIWNNTAQSV